jgi:hypothetical protein
LHDRANVGLGLDGFGLYVLPHELGRYEEVACSPVVHLRELVCLDEPNLELLVLL